MKQSQMEVSCSDRRQFQHRTSNRLRRALRLFGGNERLSGSVGNKPWNREGEIRSRARGRRGLLYKFGLFLSPLSRPPLNLYVAGDEGRRVQYTRTLSPTCLLFPPADLKVCGSSPLVPTAKTPFQLRHLSAVSAPRNSKPRLFNRIEVLISLPAKISYLYASRPSSSRRSINLLFSFLRSDRFAVSSAVLVARLATSPSLVASQESGSSLKVYIKELGRSSPPPPHPRFFFSI